MTIQIIKVITVQDEMGEDASRSAAIIVSSGGNSRFWNVGGLPLSGGVQALLDAQEAAIWAEASVSGREPTDGEVAMAESRAWFVANSGAVTAIFGGTVTSLDSSLTTLLNAMFPSATANQKTQMRYALMAGLLACRVLANNEGLV